MRSIAITRVSSRARRCVLAATVLLLITGVVAVRSGADVAAGDATCTSAEKSQYQAAAVAYAKRMLKDRARYFKTHKSAKLRAAFVKKQKAKLKALRLKAACDDSTPPEPAPPPIDLNPSPSASESFNFGPGMPPAATELIKGDIAFAAEDENRLVGLALKKVTVFASADANWLATQQCSFYGYGGNCVSGTASFYSSGQSAAQGGPGAVFIYWRSVPYELPRSHLANVPPFGLEDRLEVVTAGVDRRGVRSFGLNSPVPNTEVRRAGSTDDPPLLVGPDHTRDRRPDRRCRLRCLLRGGQVGSRADDQETV